MTKDFRSDVEFNNAATVIGNLTASAGTTKLGTASIVTGSNPGLIATQPWVQAQGYGSGGGSSSSITASAGTVGGWNISSSSLYNQGSASSYAGMLSASTASYAFFAGGQNNSGSAAQFYVTPAGTLTSNSASISGVVTFTSGTLGPFTVSSSALSSSSGTFSASTGTFAGNLTASVGITTLGTASISTLKATTGSVGGLQIFAGNNTSAFMALGASTLPNYYTTPAGNYSVAIGYQTQQYIRAGFGGGNISMGYYNLVASAGNPIDNIVIGNYAFGGENAGVNSLTGTGNVIIGNSALANASGTNSTNTAIGVYAMYNYTVGPVVGNTSIGYATLNNLTTGIRNTVVGANSGATLSDGSYNLILGSALNAPSGSVSGIVLIGNDSAGGKATATDSNQIILGTASHKTIIPGTASVGGNRVTTNDIIRGLNHVPLGSVENISRNIVNNTTTLSASAAYYSFFTAAETINASSISIYTTSTLTASILKFGLYTVSNAELSTASLTLVARTASTSTTTALQNITTKAFEASGGYPANYTLIAGNRYAIGIYFSGTSAPIVSCTTYSQNTFNVPPIMSKLQLNVFDLTSASLASALAATQVYIWSRVSGSLA